MSVIEHDFGLSNRLTERRFGKLLELDALHEANIRANPLPYLERASERIFRLQAAMFEAIQAAKPPTPGPAPDVGECPGRQGGVSASEDLCRLAGKSLRRLWSARRGRLERGARRARSTL